jgi:tetratricopeptide (TPR) repeat protein
MRTFAVRTRIILAATSCLPYLNTVGNELVYDDRALIVENELVRSLNPAPVLLGPSLSIERLEWYRPLTIYTFSLQYSLHASQPAGYHLVNIVLHLLNVLLLFEIGRRLLGEDRTAFLAAGLFALHPIHVEAVVPVSGRADLLSTLLVLTAWRWALLEESRAPLVRSGAVAIAFFAALLSKEGAIAGWPLILLTDLWRHYRGERGGDFNLRSRIPVHAALALAAASYFVLRAAALGGWLIPTDNPVRYIENPLVDETRPMVRVATAGWVLLRYVGLLVAPLRLSADYSYNQVPVVAALTDPRGWTALVALLAAAAVLGLGPRIYRLLGLMFLVAWAPISNLWISIGTLMAERLMYLPSALFCLALASVFALGLSRPSVRLPSTFLLVAVFAFYSARTLVRNRDWRDQEALFAATVRTAPRSAKAHFNYATELLRTGRLPEAEAELETALAIAERYPEAHSALGTIYMQRNELLRAEAEFQRALEQNPRLSSAWLNVGLSYFRSGRNDEASRALQESIRIDPRPPLGWATLGALAERRGERDEALRFYREAYELDPDFPGLSRHFADLLEAAGHLDEANRIRGR